MEASTGIEPVYTDLQSAASPLRQLASLVVAPSGDAGYNKGLAGVQATSLECDGLNTRYCGWLSCRAFVSVARLSEPINPILEQHYDRFHSPSHSHG